MEAEWNFSNMELKNMLVKIYRVNSYSIPSNALHPQSIYRPMRITPAAISFWIFIRTCEFFMCSCSAAGSLLACWRMLCITGSWRTAMIWKKG